MVSCAEIRCIILGYKMIAALTKIASCSCWLCHTDAEYKSQFKWYNDQEGLQGLGHIIGIIS